MDTQARDERFDVRQAWHDMVNLPADDPESHQEFLHRQMNEEIESLEIAARNLVDFPQEEWELRMSIARQCADEARHAVAFRRLLEERGGYPGKFPVLNFQYRIVTSIPNLIGRLAVANRSFEASGIDAIQDGLESFRRQEDAEFTELFDQQLADEIQHVRFANDWVKRMIERDGGSAVMALARAVSQADGEFARVVGATPVFYPVAERVRREAGFTEDEIRWAHSRVPPPRDESDARP